MPLAARTGASPSPVPPLLNAWAIAELSRQSDPPPAPATVTARCQIVARVHAAYGDAGLFDCPPEQVSLALYGGRASSNRRRRSRRRIESALEDFRTWYTAKSNRGEV